ncbi:MAG: hypothetical protein ABN479_09510 [Billgrantia sp.]|uniref:Peptidase C-terminal archaeal/bacterial domain-containing protein n=1 Tax=Billgrantia desiderata TaxID=52021 RepID=A0ABS9B8L8_9GAMM|nr:hypothetical protein [Halomonas desiderata]MCE8010058.1 hypothetical protein [Halomonas desiderata]MCE8043787.1 hypothetical protein [Halomonas desiderata]MCE8048490.1 hypothetical protein [Halomonas desiderata]
MANRASSTSLAALGGAAIGLIVGWQVPSSSTAPVPAIDQAVAEDRVSTSSLQLGERLRSEITSSSELNGKDGSRFERFHLPLEEGTLIEIELGGPLHGTLTLYDAELQLLTSSAGPMYYDASTAASLRRRIDEGGEYVVVVSGQDMHSYGPFTLTTREMELTTSDTLAMPSRADGWLQDGGDTFSVTIEESGLYQFEMRSSDVDAYLVLEGPNGYRREDDDSAGNLDARIADFLEPGEYRLTARSAYGQDSGLYTLELAPHELASDETLRNSGELAIDEPLFGWFSGNGLEYQLTLEAPAMVTLDMLSADFDAFLELHGDGVFASDDDGGEGLNARLIRSLEAGEYTVLARSHSGQGSGLFELRAAAIALDELASEGQLESGRALQAWLEPGARNVYEIVIEEAGDYRLDLHSDDFDAYLELEGEGLFLSDDDGGDGMNSRIATHLEAGTYRATARAYGNSESGSFTLSLSAE